MITKSHIRKYSVCMVGMEWVLGLDSGVQGFAPQYSTQKGRVLGQRWHLPTSKNILIELKLAIC